MAKTHRSLGIFQDAAALVAGVFFVSILVGDWARDSTPAGHCLVLILQGNWEILVVN